MSLFGAGCSAAQGPDYSKLPVPSVDPDVDRGDDSVRSVVLAGGCFWCVEGVFEQLDGVVDVVSGYAGGSADDAVYDAVSMGRTAHAEVVRVRYDPSQINFGTLLRVFFATHDPTQLNRQGPDRGRQYRSAVFVADEQQRAAVESYIKQLDAAKVYSDPVVTTVEPLTAFHAAEDYHQDFVALNPGHPYIVQQALPKIEKLKKLFPGELKD
jgi:peptide-methionine (S)-S-oxide reductase